MNKTCEIIRREYLERVRKKSFWISTILFPVLVLGSVFLPTLFMSLDTGQTTRLAVVDLNGKVFEAFQENLLRKSAPHRVGKGNAAKKFETADSFVLERIDPGPDPARTMAELKKKVGEKKYDGVLYIGHDLEKEDSFQFFGRNVSNIQNLERLERALNFVLLSDRLIRNKVNATSEQIRLWTKGVDLKTFQVEEGGNIKKSGFQVAFFVSFTFVFILYLALLIYGIAALRGVLEEKTSRVMEVLLSSFTPKQLMAGKLMGIGLVGLTQMGIYALTAAVAGIYATIAAAAMDPDILEAIRSFNPLNLVYFLVFFVLGYIMFSALFLGVGSMCSSEEDAQNLQSIVMIPVILPLMFAMFFISNPDSTVAIVVSLIPLFTPMVMLMRVMTVTPPLWQILLSIFLTIGFTYFVVWMVAKIFRVGILSYGKRPTMKELWVWFRSA